MSGMDIPDYSYGAKLSNVYHARDKVDWNKQFCHKLLNSTFQQLAKVLIAKLDIHKNLQN